MTTTSRRTRAANQERIRRVFKTEIEFIGGDSFHTADADAVILAPAPAGSSGESRRKPPPGTPPFLSALYEFPLLTQPQEHHLFRKMNYLKFQAASLRDTLGPGRVSLATVNRFERMLSDALSIRNHIVRSNLRLVVSIARKLIDRANSFDDLVSDGIPPLIRAVEIFDFDRGTRFSTYATWAIRNCLFRASTRNHKLRSRFRTSAESVFAAKAETRASVREDVAYHERLRETVRRGLKELDERDRKIVKARFALDGSDRPLRFREIAEELHISTERVRQLFARSLGRLEDAVGADALAVV